jgi:putative effector of murein hydrolase LrgA (UPF0299 family)
VAQTGPSPTLLRIAGYSAILSGAVGVAMVGTLIAMYGLFALGPEARSTALKVGWVNDVLAIVVYGMALPIVPAVHSIVRETGETRSVVIALVGAGALIATVVLQWLLATGALAFEQQILPVSIALLAAGTWMVGTGLLARSVGSMPHGLRNGLLGALYVGYPVWAIDLGRRFLSR